MAQSEAGRSVVKTDVTNNNEEEEFGPQLIAKLQVDGITADDIKNLQAEGFYTCDSLMLVPRKRLLDIKGFSDGKVEKLLEEAQKYVPMGFLSASDLHEKRVEIVRLTTGSREIDNLLNGGFETGEITEIFGESGIGKTQLCHMLAVTCQLPFNQGGGEGKCMYIDTDNTFRPERLLPIAQRYNLHEKDVLDNISVARAYNSDHLTRLLDNANQMMLESRYALIVIDSVMSLYRSEYVGFGELLPRQQHLNQFLRKLKTLVDAFGVAAVITNQVVASFDANSTMSKVDPQKAAGGDILAHASTTRLHLRKGRRDARICKVHKSPCLPNFEAIFFIHNEGIGDQKE